MKMNKVTLNIALIICFSTIRAYATPVLSIQSQQWYIGSYIGALLKGHGDTEIPAIASREALTSEPVYDAGNTFGFNLGYKFLSTFRIEGEAAYQNLSMYKINNAIGPGTVTSVNYSQTKLLSLFTNSYYDFKLFQHATPYLGAGIGYIKVKNMIHPIQPIPVAPHLFFTEKNLNYGTFGYQGIIGLSYRFNNYIALSLDGKYLSTFVKEATGQTNLGTDHYQTKQKITSDTVTLGFTYYFS